MTEQLFIKQMGVFTDPTRLKIICILAKNNFCSMHLEKLIGVSQPNISRHIDKMINAEVVDVKKIGRRNIYNLNATFIKSNADLIAQVCELYKSEFAADLIETYGQECKELT